MALQIVPSQKLPPVKRSVVLAIAGIPQPNPLSPNGRVFRRLAGDVPNFTIGEDGHIDDVMTYEEAFLIRFARWLGPLAPEFGDLFKLHGDEFRAKAEAFKPKLQAHRKAYPPPWAADAVTAGRVQA